MGRQSMVRRILPHLMSCLSRRFPVVSARLTDLNLNRRSASGMLTMVNSSMTESVTNSDDLQTAYSPAKNRLLSKAATKNRQTNTAARNWANNILRACCINIVFYLLNGVRSRMDRPMVTSSVYSSSLPTDIPRAITLSFTSKGCSLRDM